MKSQKSKLNAQNSNPPSPPFSKGGMGGLLKKKLFTIHCSLFTNNKGFTIIELVITMVLIGIVAFIVADAMSTGFKTYFTTDNRKEALDQARIAMERMTREIRNLRDSSSIIASSTTQFNFTDIDGNAINFIWTSPNITRNGNTLATNITSFSFGYIRADSTNVDAVFNPALPPDPARTRRIRITLASTVSGERVTLQSEVWPRNL